MGSIEKQSLQKNTDLKDYPSEGLYLLLKTIEGINRTMELKSLLAESMEAVRIVMDAEASSLMLLDEDTGELYISLPTGPVKEEIKGTRIPRNEGIGGWVVEHKQPYLSNDIDKSKFFWGDIVEEFKTKNILCVPLINKQGNAIGVIQALNRRRNIKFTSRDIPVFQALAAHITIAIERARQVEHLYSRLNQKEVLLTEIHHRVKNNLATISALIEMELESVKDEHARHVLKNTYSRIRSMTEVHDLLCQKGLFDELELGLYLHQLSNKVSKTLSDSDQEVTIEVKADTILISADRAMLCGLILNELLVNIYKHAFKNSKGGEIVIELHSQKSNHVKLVVKDNGVGIPDDFDLQNKSSIGTWVINILLRKLKAKVEINRSKGTSFSIYFSK